MSLFCGMELWRIILIIVILVGGITSICVQCYVFGKHQGQMEGIAEGYSRAESFWKPLVERLRIAAAARDAGRK